MPSTDRCYHATHNRLCAVHATWPGASSVGLRSMAEDQRSRGLPQQQQRSNPADDRQYPPIAGEEDDRSRGIPYHPRPTMATAPLTLPSIQDPHGAYGPSGGRSWEARAGSYGPSPASTNGYPPPGSGTPGTSYSPSPAGSAFPPPGPIPQYLPPVQPPPQDSRANYPPDPRAPPYYTAQRPPVPYQDPYGFAYRPDRGPPGAFPPDYPRAAPGGAAVMQQSAPRQRTSIACRYCRRRKVSFEKLRRQLSGGFRCMLMILNGHRFAAAVIKIRREGNVQIASR